MFEGVALAAVFFLSFVIGGMTSWLILWGFFWLGQAALRGKQSRDLPATEIARISGEPEKPAGQGNRQAEADSLL